jgi:bifunctional UDP-N-acetylglucosamine pyrophosphorylase/glucosamine-1-phosphate N-acetyltransferase
MKEIAGIVLAAGLGQRMKSRLPKPLHKLCGKELVRYPIDLLRECGVERVLVVVSPANRDALHEALGDTVEYVVQPGPLGTGHAVACCAEAVGSTASHVVVIGGDTPLVEMESLSRLLENREGRRMGLLTGHDPALHDLGRIVRRDGKVEGVVEAADAAAAGVDEYAELNAGVYCFEGAWLWESIGEIAAGLAGEHYLTDLAAIAAHEAANVETVPAGDPTELLGVNDRVQLARAEAVQQQRLREHWMMRGVTMTDPPSVFIDADAAIGMDTVILPNTMVLGRTTVGEDCEIGPGSMVRDCSIGDGCRVTASVLEESVMESGSDIGPYSHLRPGAYIETGVHIGNFVEVKESRLASGVAMGHFGYVGDASIGARVNVGAGMVTCNYDGKDKHRTVIEEDAFIGCDTMLVAPVTVGAGSITGAGAVVTRNVPPARLAVGIPATIKRELK